MAVITENYNILAEIKNTVVNKMNSKLLNYFADAYWQAFPKLEQALQVIMPNVETTKGVYPTVRKYELVKLFSNQKSEIKKIIKKPINEMEKELITRFNNTSKKSVNVFECLDLAGFFKLNRDFSPTRIEIYNGLKKVYPSIQALSVDEWTKLNRETGDNRNIVSHLNTNDFKNLDSQTIKEMCKKSLEYAEYLTNDKNRERLEEIKESYRELQKQLDYQQIALSEFQNNGYSESEMEHIFRSHGYTCDAGYVAIESKTKGDTILDQEKKANKEISIEQISEMINIKPAQIKDILALNGIPIQGNTIKGISDSIVCKIINHQLYGSGNDKRANLDIKLLQEYCGGDLGDYQLEELMTNYQIVLDTSMFCERSGRDFLEYKLLPMLSKIRGQKKGISLVVEATQRLRLFEKVEEYKKLKTNFLNMQNRITSEDELSHIKNNLEELKKYNTAYTYMEDSLHKAHHALYYVGTPKKYHTNEEALKEYVESNEEVPVCVVTSGATMLTEYLYPTGNGRCLLARVKKKIGAKNIADKAVISIFPEYIENMKKSTSAKDIETSEDIEAVSGIQEEDRNNVTEKETEETIKAKVHIEEKEEYKTQNLVEQERPKSDINSRNKIRNTLKEFDTTPIQLSQSITRETVLYTSEKQIIHLQNLLYEDGTVAEGGEGVIYTTDYEGYIAKLYHTDANNYRLTKGRQEKLEMMISNNPGLSNVMWPKSCLYIEDGTFVGFLMPMAPQGVFAFDKSVVQLQKEAIRKEVLPGWNRKDLVQIACEVAKTMAQLHKKGILMGDINFGNFLADSQDSSKVYFVDCDSYQMQGYVCPVGRPEFTHPATAKRIGVIGDLQFEQFLRTEEEEDYVLAMMIFQILFLNEYPFSVKGSMTPEQAMREKVFPYAIEEKKLMPDGSGRMIWANLPIYIKQAFLDVFKEWKHISIKRWSKLLTNYLKEIENGKFTYELNPYKYRESNPENPVFVDVKCDICGREYNLHKESPVLAYKNIKLCSSCLSLKQRWKKIARDTQCNVCGKQFKSNQWNAYLCEKDNRKEVCPECSNIKLNCEACGKDFIVPFERKSTINNKLVLCKTCKNKERILFPCDKCKSKTEIERRIVYGSRNNNKLFLCRNCMRKERERR